MGNCFSGDAPHRRSSAAAAEQSDPDGLGHSFCYLRPPESPAAAAAAAAASKVYHHATEETTTFRSISGASVSANAATPLSTTLYLSELTWPAAAAFESSTSISAVPLQPIPLSGPLDRAGFLSGPIERGFLSGPLDQFSGPLRRSLSHAPRRRRSLLRGLSKALARTRSLVAPLGRASRRSDSAANDHFSSEAASASDPSSDTNLHWAQGRAGEDRVHVVISEEEDHGWVFVGIYDGFNGPDATDYLLSNLYSAVQRELKGLLWDDDQFDRLDPPPCVEQSVIVPELPVVIGGCWDEVRQTKRRRLRGAAKKWEEKQRRWKSEWDRERLEMDRKLKEQLSRTCSAAAANHSEVLKALSRALKTTEDAYLDVADQMLLDNPELALMGSCVLVMVMKGEDVYLLNVGDSRAVLAHKAEPDLWSTIGKAKQDLERISEEASNDYDDGDDPIDDELLNLAALQLTKDHSTSIEEEIQRIRDEHRDDASAIANDRVKGSLKVTRAFGAGFLKQPKWNEALLEVFRIDYVGTSPYITCNPSLRHHKLEPKDRFLILSSDGLYQYFTNEEAVAEVELFIATTPEGDPAQHLVEEVLFRAANKAGMDFHELLEIPQGDRRRYHDDVSIIVISLEGRIWRSCV